MSQLDFVKAKIAAGAQPWTSALSKAKGYSLSSLTYTPAPYATLDRATGSATAIARDDIAAYSDALIYSYTGNTQYADKSIQIMNAWSSTLKNPVTSSAQLDAAWAAEVFPRAAEIIRYTYTPATGHAAFNVTAFSTMLTNVLLPQLNPGSAGSISANGNWELSMADGTMNIGVFTDNRTTFNTGVAMWQARVPSYIYQASDGTMPVAPPGGMYNTAAKLKCFWLNAAGSSSCTVPAGFTFTSGLAQETCRDMSHVILGFEAMINGAETARIQGVDLYGSQQTRITNGYELNAKYDLQALSNLSTARTSGSVGNGICGGTLGVGGTGYQLGWQIAYNEYALRLGIPMPYTKQMIAKFEPSSAGLHMDWETLTSVGTP
jgi:hypothetical protein